MEAGMTEVYALVEKLFIHFFDVECLLNPTAYPVPDHQAGHLAAID
jgi:hypothetical protein